MTPSDHKKYYSRFLSHLGDKLHFSAHSHHFWPDVTREAHMQYWDDAANFSDDKWNKIFSEVIPKTQGHIARILNLKDKQQIVLAPNTHELTSRLLSLFLGRKSLSILTTSSEFHSWKRQILRLMELPEVKVTTVEVSEKKKLLDDLKIELKKNPDIFFISQVFFDSGVALTDDELLELSTAASPSTIMVVDGYHGFAAIPTDLAKLEGRIFYLAGGYKYAQGGEGVAFMVVPKGDWRPAYTGWYADYANLSRPPGALVGYSNDGMAFMGATQDPSGYYRFNATWDLFQSEALTVSKIHAFITGLQKEFLQGLSNGLLEKFELRALYDENLLWHGHFLTYEAPTEEKAKAFQEALRSQEILIDRRGQRLRFGFGLYQNKADVRELCNRLQKLATFSP